MLALTTGSATAVRAFLKRNEVLKHTDDRGRSPLMIAAAWGHLSVCELLIRSGSDPFALDMDGNDAAAHAHIAGRPDVASLIALTQNLHREGPGVSGVLPVSVAATSATGDESGEIGSELSLLPVTGVPDAAQLADDSGNHELSAIESSSGGLWSIADPTTQRIEVEAPFLLSPDAEAFEIAWPVANGLPTGSRSPPSGDSGPAHNAVEEQEVVDPDLPSWEIDDRGLGRESDRVAAAAAARAQERISAVRHWSAGGEDWSSINVELPSRRIKKTGKPSAIGSTAPIAAALRQACVSGEYHARMLRLGPDVRPEVRRTLRQAVRQTVAASGCIVDRHPDPWSDVLGTPALPDNGHVDIQDQIEDFQTHYWSIGRPSFHDRHLDAILPLTRSDEMDLFRRIRQSDEEMMLTLARSPAAIDCVLAADEALRSGQLDFASISALEQIADVATSGSPMEEADEEAEPLSAYLESGLPKPYTAAADDLRRGRENHSGLMLPMELRAAARSLRDMRLASCFLEQLVDQIQEREGHRDTSDAIRAALGRQDRTREIVVERHLPAVREFARRYTGRGLDLDDLVQEGSIGLLRAVEIFDPDRGYRFWTYAQMWVFQAIQRSVADRGSAIRLPVHVHGSRRRIEKATQAARDAGLSVETSSLAEALGISEKSVSRLLEIPSVHSLEDLDTLVGDGIAGAKLVDATSAGPLEDVARSDLSRTIAMGLALLEPRVAEIIRLRFGLGPRNEHTLEEVGQKYGVTRERIRQIESKGLKALSHPARSLALRSLFDS